MDALTIALTVACVLAAAFVITITLLLSSREEARAREEDRLEAKRGDFRDLGTPALTLPVVKGDPDQLCRTCAHFDLEEGQAMASHHGPFALAAQFVPPSEMGAVATPEGEIEARDIPARTKWSEFGLCGARREGIWGGTDAARRERMQGDSGVPSTFLASYDPSGLDCYEAKP